MPAQHRIGLYRLDRLLGVGGMAEAWLAYRPGPLDTGKVVVLKRVLPQQAGSRAFAEAFVDEARLSVRLNHPNIVQVMEVGEQDGNPFLVMEWVDGIDLENLLSQLARQGRRMPIGLVVRLAADMLQALDYAHRLADENGQPLHIVHRDVSPPNVLLGRHGEVKLADFGIAKARGRLSKTAFGLLKGKAPYMSPEQAQGWSMDHRSDLFSVGAVFWECLIGRRLFDDGDDFAVLRRVREAAAEPPSRYREGIDPALDALLQRLLARRPEDRFADAGAALRALQATRWYRDTPVSELAGLVAQFAGETPAVKVRQTDGLPEPDAALPWPPPRSKKRKRIGLAAVLVIVAAVGLLGWWWLKTGPAALAPPGRQGSANAQATLIVQPATGGAVVFLDDRALGQAPLARNFPTDKKRHELLMLRPGFAAWRQSMNLAKSRLIDAQQRLPRQAGLVRAPADSNAHWSVANYDLDPAEEIWLPTGFYLARERGGRQQWVGVSMHQPVDLASAP